eukprot:Skav215195  [mRNA]  locus=scaffold3330:127286:128755:- [translate_table: standard]
MKSSVLLLPTHLGSKGHDRDPVPELRGRSGGSTDAKKKGSPSHRLSDLVMSEEKYKPDENAGTESMDVGTMSAKPRRLKKAC